MIHAPETLEEASGFNVDFVLCGHTHGGQVCLPSGRPIWIRGRCPKGLSRGPWEYRGMPGYTSAGTGTSFLPLRFNCPPEIAVHTLKRRADA
jgi:predicted MPP superfamily phosphohydrolase